jgi:hypothetical protein
MATKITVAELLIDMGVGKNDAAKAAGKLDKRLAGTLKTAKKLGGGLVKLTKGFAIFAAAASAAALVVFKFVDSVATTGDEIAKTAKKVGAGVEELQRLRFAADRSGADVAKMDLAIKNLAKNMEDAKNNGALPFRQALEEMGISLTELEGLTVEEKFGVFADAMLEVEDAGQRVALAMNTFGARAGPELIPLLLESSKGITALGDKAEELGLVMTVAGVKTSEGFVDSMTNLKAIVTGLKNAIGVELMPQVGALIDRFTQWVKVNRDMIAEKTPEFFNRVIEVAKKLLPVFEKIGQALLFVADNFETLIILFAGVKLAGAFSSVIAGFSAMGIAAGAALGPIGLIAIALATLIPLAINAGNKIGDALARDEALTTTKRESVALVNAPVGSAAAATQFDIVKESKTIREGEADIRRIREEEGSRGSAKEEIVVKRIDAAKRERARLQRRQAGEIAEAEFEAEVNAEVDAEFLAAEQAETEQADFDGPDLQIGPQLRGKTGKLDSTGALVGRGKRTGKQKPKISAVDRAIAEENKILLEIFIEEKRQRAANEEIKRIKKFDGRDGDSRLNKKLQRARALSETASERLEELGFKALRAENKILETIEADNAQLEADEAKRDVEADKALLERAILENPLTSVEDLRRGIRTDREKDEKTPTSRTTVADLLTAASSGDLAGLATATPSADAIEPTVAVTITNNNTTFNNKQTIDGGSSPQETADLSAKAINTVLNERLAKAAQSLQGNTVI